MDKKGGLHIAAQEVNSAKLWYLYMTKGSDNKYKVTQSCLVDATSSVGRWTDIQIETPSSTSPNWYEYKPVISYLNKASLNTPNAVKVAWIEKYDTTEKKAYWEAMTDAAKYEGRDDTTSIAQNVSEGTSNVTSKIAVDFLRDEQ